MKDPSKPFLVSVVDFSGVKYDNSALLEEYSKWQEVDEAHKRHTTSGGKPWLDEVRDVPITDVISRLGLEVRNGFIVGDDGKSSSAAVNIERNFVHRFS